MRTADEDGRVAVRQNGLACMYHHQGVEEMKGAKYV